jgi:hypothetical protein
MTPAPNRSTFTIRFSMTAYPNANDISTEPPEIFIDVPPTDSDDDAYPPPMASRTANPS